MTLSTQILGAGGQAPQIDFTTRVHGSAEREEMSVTSPITLRVVALEDCLKGTYTAFDPALKIYTTEPLAAAPPDLLGLANLQPWFQPVPAGAANATGTMTNTVTVKDLGVDMAPDAKVSAHHFAIDTHTVATGAAGSSDTRRHSDVWIDPAMPRPSCPMREQSPRTVAVPGGASYTYTLAGDVAAYQKVADYLPVEIRVSSSANPLLFVRSASSTTPQDAAAFTLPAAYKQVALGEFTQAVMNEILDGVSGPQPTLPNR